MNVASRTCSGATRKVSQFRFKVKCDVYKFECVDYEKIQNDFGIRNVLSYENYFKST